MLKIVIIGLVFGASIAFIQHYFKQERFKKFSDLCDRVNKKIDITTENLKKI